MPFSQTVAATLVGITIAVPGFGGHEQFKAHMSGALAARRKSFMSLEAGFVRQAVLRVQDFIDPRGRDRLARLEKCLGGIGSHALCRVA